MHELVVVHYSRGWKATLFYFLDLVAVAMLLIAAWAVYEFYTLPVPIEPTPAEHITLPQSRTQVPIQKI